MKYGKTGELILLNYFDYPKKQYEVRSNILLEKIVNSTPLVTIAIPTFNRSGLLNETIQSVVEALKDCSHSENIELIILDNHSTKDSVFLFDSLFKDNKLSCTVRYYYNEANIGMFGNWNRCLELAKGKWISILNDDDLFCPNILNDFFKQDVSKYSCIMFQYKYLIEHHKTSLQKFIDYLITLKLRKTSIVSFDSYYWGMPHMGSLGVFFNKEKALEVNGFPEQYFPINDWIFFSKYMYKNGSGLKINKASAYYRIGVNESMKTEVALKSMDFSYNYRSFLNTFLNFKFHEMMNRMFILSRMASYKRNFHITDYGVNLKSMFSITFTNQIFWPFFIVLQYLRRVFL